MFRLIYYYVCDRKQKMKKRINSADIDEATVALNALPQPPAEGSEKWKEIMRWYDTAKHMRYKKGIAALANTIARASIAHRNFSTAEPYLKEARKLCEASKAWPDLYLDCLLMSTELESTYGRFDEAVRIADVILCDYSKTMAPAMFIKAHIVIGNIYQMRGWLYHASHIYRKVLARKELYMDVMWFAGAWINQALVLHELKLYDEALAELKEMLHTERLKMSPFDKAFMHMYLALVFAHGYKDYKNFKAHSEACVKVCREHKIESVETFMMMNVAYSLVALGRFEEALPALQNERAVASVKDNDTEFGELHNAIAECLLKTGKTKEALPHLRIAEKGLLHSDSYKNKFKYYDNLFLYHTQAGDSARAAEAHKAATEALINSTRADHQLQLMQLNALMQLEQKENELEIQNLKQIKMQQDIELANQEKAMMQSAIEQRNNLIDEFQSAIKKIERTDLKRAEIFKVLNDKIKSVKMSNAELSSYDTKFNKQHTQAMTQLRAKYPDITHSEAKIAVMLSSGLSNKEIAALTLTTSRNIETQRLKLRKKLKLKTGQDLLVKLLEILQTSER